MTKSKKAKALPMPMVHRAAPISVSVALGHTSVNAVKATGGDDTLVAPYVQLAHSILLYRARKGSDWYTISKVFGMTWPGLVPMTY